MHGLRLFHEDTKLKFTNDNLGMTLREIFGMSACGKFNLFILEANWKFCKDLVDIVAMSIGNIIKIIDPTYFDKILDELLDLYEYKNPTTENYIVFYKTNTHRIEISDQEFNEPIVKYLEKNNIERGCWVNYQGNVDTNQSFHQSLDNCVDLYRCNTHTKDCIQSKCDLMSFIINSPGCYSQTVPVTRRMEKCEIVGEFDDEIFVKRLSLPSICNKDTIIKTFLKKMTDENKYIRIIDLNLYCRKTPMRTGRRHLEKAEKIIKEDNFILSYCCDNDDIVSDKKIEYFIVSKMILPKDFYNLLSVPVSLCDIIYEYVDFDSMSPLFKS